MLRVIIGNSPMGWFAYAIRLADKHMKDSMGFRTFCICTTRVKRGTFLSIYSTRHCCKPDRYQHCTLPYSEDHVPCPVCSNHPAWIIEPTMDLGIS